MRPTRDMKDTNDMNPLKDMRDDNEQHFSESGTRDPTQKSHKSRIGSVPSVWMGA